MWNTSYEIPNPDVETDSDSAMPATIDFEFSKSSDIGSHSFHELSTASIPVQKKDFKLPQPAVPLGKLIRACAHPTAPSYMRLPRDVRPPRDRYRERSVSRARDIIVASKRRDAGLPPVNFHPPAYHSKYRDPNMQPPLSRHTGGYSNAGSRLLQPDMRSADRYRADTLASTNTGWLQDSIKVSCCVCIPPCISSKL